MKTFTIEHNNGTKRNPNVSVYEFAIVGDLDKPGALRILRRNDNRTVCMNQVSNTAYRAAIEAAKKLVK